MAVDGAASTTRYFRNSEGDMQEVTISERDAILFDLLRRIAEKL